MLPMLSMLSMLPMPSYQRCIVAMVVESVVDHVQ
jgi:hypothetical protein